MIGQFAAMVEKGTVDARNGKADATTTRLIALFEDHCLQGREPENPDQQRQRELRRPG